MLRRWFFWMRFVLSLVFIGVLVLGCGALYQFGFNQGYAQATLAAGVESAPNVPAAPYYHGTVGSYYGFSPFLFFGGIALVGLFAFLIFGGLFGSHRWRHGSMGSWPGGWSGYYPYGRKPPWWDEPREPDFDGVEPPGGNASAGESGPGTITV
jgi:hypothetical protein